MNEQTVDSSCICNSVHRRFSFCAVAWRRPDQTDQCRLFTLAVIRDAIRFRRADSDSDHSCRCPASNHHPTGTVLGDDSQPHAGGDVGCLLSVTVECRLRCGSRRILHDPDFHCAVCCHLCERACRTIWLDSSCTRIWRRVAGFTA